MSGLQTPDPSMGPDLARNKADKERNQTVEVTKPKGRRARREKARQDAIAKVTLLNNNESELFEVEPTNVPEEASNEVEMRGGSESELSELDDDMFVEEYKAEAKQRQKIDSNISYPILSSIEENNESELSELDDAQFKDEIREEKEKASEKKREKETKEQQARVNQIQKETEEREIKEREAEEERRAKEQADGDRAYQEEMQKIDREIQETREKREKEAVGIARAIQETKAENKRKQIALMEENSKKIRAEQEAEVAKQKFNKIRQERKAEVARKKIELGRMRQEQEKESTRKRIELEQLQNRGKELDTNGRVDGNNLNSTQPTNKPITTQAFQSSEPILQTLYLQAKTSIIGLQRKPDSPGQIISFLDELNQQIRDCMSQINAEDPESYTIDYQTLIGFFTTAAPLCEAYKLNFSAENEQNLEEFNILHIYPFLEQKGYPRHWAIGPETFTENPPPTTSERETDHMEVDPKSPTTHRSAATFGSIMPTTAAPLPAGPNTVPQVPPPAEAAWQGQQGQSTVTPPAVAPVAKQGVRLIRRGRSPSIDESIDVEYLASKLRGSKGKESSYPTTHKPFKWRPGYKETGEKIEAYHPIWAEDKLDRIYLRSCKFIVEQWGKRNPYKIEDADEIGAKARDGYINLPPDKKSDIRAKINRFSKKDRRGASISAVVSLPSFNPGIYPWAMALVTWDYDRPNRWVLRSGCRDIWGARDADIRLEDWYISIGESIPWPKRAERPYGQELPVSAEEYEEDEGYSTKMYSRESRRGRVPDDADEEYETDEGYGTKICNRESRRRRDQGYRRDWEASRNIDKDRGRNHLRSQVQLLEKRLNQIAKRFELFEGTNQKTARKGYY